MLRAQPAGRSASADTSCPWASPCEERPACGRGWIAWSSPRLRFAGLSIGNRDVGQARIASAFAGDESGAVRDELDFHTANFAFQMRLKLGQQLGGQVIEKLLAQVFGNVLEFAGAAIAQMQMVVA